MLFQGSVGRVDLPGGDWPTLLASIGTLHRPFRRRPVYPGHMGITTLGRERATNPFLRELAPESRRAERRSRPRAAPSTCCPRTPRAATARRGQARRILGAAGYRRIETPIFEATELFARGVGEATDIVQKEMYTFDDGGGRSLTLRPEGTAPVCRAYVEHGMHKLAQPVKLWYLSPFFRREAPQKGRYRQFWQVGAEAIGSDGPETDAEMILLLAELLEALRVTDTRLRLSSLGQPGDPRRLPRGAGRLPARARGRSCAADVRARIDLNPMRAFDASDRAGRRRSWPRRRKLLDRLDPEDAEHFAAVRALLDDAGLPYELDPTLVRGLDYYTRTLFEFTSDALGAQSGVGGGGRYDGLVEQLGGPPTPGVGWAAGVERMLLAAAEQPSRRRLVDLLRRPRRAAARARGRVRLAREARRAGLAAQIELAGRSLKGQLKHADRLGARYVAIVTATRQAQLKDMDSGEQQEIELGAVIAAILRGEPAVVRQSPRPNGLPRRLGRRAARRARRRRGPRRRLGAPPPRPRRADLHRPARPLRARAARLPPRARARGPRSCAHRCAPRTCSPRRAPSSAATPENVNPNLATGEIELDVGRRRDPRRRRDAAVPDRRGRPVDEKLRLRHRALDLRREPMRDALDLRHRGRRRRCATCSTSATSSRSRRRILTRSTPEGARDFLVPARGCSRVVLRAAAVAAAVQAAADDRRASSATTRSPAASATRTCAPTACPSSPSSTSRWRSSTRTT